MQRGGVSHRFILFLNMTLLTLLIGIVAINNLDVNIGKLLIGFSASIIAVTINGLMDKKIQEPYYYLFVPFISTAIFIIFGILTLSAFTTSMDLETLAAVNFAFTLIFAFIYFLSTKSKQHKKAIKQQKTQRTEHHHAHHVHEAQTTEEEKEVKQEPEEPKQEIIKKEIKEEKREIKHTTHQEHKTTHVVHHHVHTHKQEEKHEKPKSRDFLDELKKEFNIINIDQTKIMDSLKELKASKHEAKIHDILDKLEKDEIFFASVTGEKFHKPLCIVINHIHHDQIIAFRDEKEAVMEGYKPCKVCMPQS